MRRAAGIVPLLILIAACVSPNIPAAEGPVEPNLFFYQGNTQYTAQNYVEALSAYEKVLAAGLESANLYYNIGNGFFKMGKYGYAILCYERARRISPGDSDTRSNLAYARNLTGEPSFTETTDPVFLKAFKRPFRDVGLDNLIRISLGLYIIAALLIAFNMLNPVFGRKIRIITICIILMTAYAVIVCGVRYYVEVIQRYGIVLTKEAECRFEPINKSAVYFKLREGSEVLVTATHGDWRKVRRADGKAGWVKVTAVEII